MNYEAFLDQVTEDLGSFLPYHHGPVEIHKVDVEKIDAPSYRGLSIGKKGADVSFTLPLEAFFERLQNGQNYYNVVSEIADKADRQLADMPAINAAELSSYDNIRSHLMMELVGTKANQGMLRSVPHTEVEDMSVIYRVKVDLGGDREASAVVTNRMMDAFGITKEQLHTDALENAPLTSPATLRGMADVLGEMMGTDPMNVFPPAEPAFYVASTTDGQRGAACVLYPGFLEAAKKVVGDQFFILPSSVHEMLLLPDNGMMETAELKAMVTAINADIVDPDEVLTDNVYHYDGDERIFEMAETYDKRQAEIASGKKSSLLENLKRLEKESEMRTAPAPKQKSGRDEMSL